MKLERNTDTDRLWHPVSSVSSHSTMLSRTDKSASAQLCHRRLGQLHPDGVINFLKRYGHPAIERGDFLGCEGCALGKSIQSPSNSPFYRSCDVLDLVHSNILGLIRPPTGNGKQYILSFINDFTRYNHLYLLTRKDETAECFAKYKGLVERQTDRKIGKLKSNWGGEYSSTEFMHFLKKKGIETERAPAHCPPVNSVSERFFRTLLGRMRTQLSQSGLPSQLWGELAIYCGSQINGNPSMAIQMSIPMIEYKKVITGHIHPFDFTRL